MADCLTCPEDELPVAKEYPRVYPEQFYELWLYRSLESHLFIKGSEKIIKASLYFPTVSDHTTTNNGWKQSKHSNVVKYLAQEYT